jgi:hypothetical protein
MPIKSRSPNLSQNFFNIVTGGDTDVMRPCRLRESRAAAMQLDHLARPYGSGLSPG